MSRMPWIRLDESARRGIPPCMIWHGSRRLCLLSQSILMLAALAASVPARANPYRTALEKYQPSTPDREVRALWIVRDSLKSRQSIRAIIDSMRRNNFNTAMVQVRGRGDALYQSDFIPRAAGIEAGLDPLAEFLRIARVHGIAVHAWINVFLGADITTIRTAPPTHILYTRPSWFLRDRAGRSMLDYSPAQMRRADVEGAFLDPSQKPVREYNVLVVRELLARYHVDGLHLDYIRYPFSEDGTDRDFGLGTAQSAARLETQDTLAMRKARALFVTQMVGEIRSEMRRTHPLRILSAAVWPNRKKVEEHVFQPWPDWLHKGLLDYAFLMAYYNSEQVYDERIEKFYDPLINSRMIIGVGIYKNPGPRVALHQLTSARAMGAAGVCYFQANWFLAANSPEKEKRYQLPALFQAWREPGFVPGR